MEAMASPLGVRLVTDSRVAARAIAVVYGCHRERHRKVIVYCYGGTLLGSFYAESIPYHDERLLLVLHAVDFV